MKKPFPWYGGKEALAPALVSLLPSHEVYVEVFGGSAALLFAKAPSKVEVYNDLDSGLVNFFRVLRDREQAAELERLLELTPYAREEYQTCIKTWKEADSIEKARRWFTGVVQSMNASISNTGWSSSKTVGSNPATRWRYHINKLSTFIDRLSLVQIDHRDFETVIQAYDSPGTLFYLDPPYEHSARGNTRSYTHEMSDVDHDRLLHCINQVQGMVILSGYTTPRYTEALSVWERREYVLSCSAAGRTRASGLQGDGSILANQMRTESIWLNPAAVSQQQSLWSA